MILKLGLDSAKCCLDRCNNNKNNNNNNINNNNVFRILSPDQPLYCPTNSQNYEARPMIRNYID